MLKKIRISRSRSVDKEVVKCVEVNDDDNGDHRVVDDDIDGDEANGDSSKAVIKTNGHSLSNSPCKFTSDPLLNACLVMDPANPSDPYGKFVCPRCDFVLVKEEVKVKARSFKKVFYRRAARHLLDHHQMPCPTLAHRCDEPECGHIFLRKADLQMHTKKMHEGQRSTVNW